MKLLFLICAMTFSFIGAASTDGDQNDTKIALENIQRLHQSMEYYKTDIHPLIEKLKKNKHIIFTPTENRKIKAFWVLFNDTRIVLSLLNASHSQGAQSYESQLIKYSTNLHLKLSGFHFSQKIWTNPEAHKRFNTEVKNELPKGLVIALENDLFRYSSANFAKEMPTFFPTNNLIEDFFELEKSYIGFGKTKETLSLEELNKQVEGEYKDIILPFTSKRYNSGIVRRRFLVYRFKNIFYNIVAKIAEFLGDTKIFKRDPDYYNGQTLITLKDAELFENRLKPGDIILSRTNWFLSNAFLPGFWPHSFTYMGDKEKLSAFFDTAEVKDFYSKECLNLRLECDSFETFLATAPETKVAWKSYLEKDKFNFSNILIEATSEGVHFSSARHTLLNDYLAGMRPKVSKLTKARAIYEMLSKFAYPYDYNFDFASDDSFVCSELVVKGYMEDKAISKKGLHFNYAVESEKYMEIILGRITMPVINFVHKIYDENIMKLRASELEFVAFLKGNRKLKKARFSTERDFYESRNWPKWSFLAP